LHQRTFSSVSGEVQPAKQGAVRTVRPLEHEDQAPHAPHVSGWGTVSQSCLMLLRQLLQGPQVYLSLNQIIVALWRTGETSSLPRALFSSGITLAPGLPLAPNALLAARL